MHSSQGSSSMGRTADIDNATGGHRLSAVQWVALVAVLAGAAFADFTIQTDAARGEPWPTPPEATAVAAADAKAAPEALLAHSALGHYSPGEYTSRTMKDDGTVTGGGEVRSAPPAAGTSTATPPGNQTQPNDGNVMTYEHD